MLIQEVASQLTLTQPCRDDRGLLNQRLLHYETPQSEGHLQTKLE